MSELTVSNLASLLHSSVLRNCPVVDQSFERLTAPGENYGSLMLLVTVTYKDQTDQVKQTTLVAKKIPENEWLRKMFKIQSTFLKEMAFYGTIVPHLVRLQKEKNPKRTIDFFPDYYGGQINANGSRAVDEDGVILLQDLKASGFVTGERTEGFDLETTELVLRDLAVFHALPIALKFSSPELFEETIMPHLKPIQIFDSLSKESEDTLVEEKHDLARENENTAHLAELVRSNSRRAAETYRNPRHSPREPFATIRHNDFWVNNTMIKYEGGKPVKTKIIDFQTIDYGSPAKDVVFFLFTSVQFPVIKEHYDRFVNLYFETFINTLDELNCDTVKFTFNGFLHEMEIEARATELYHVLNMLKPIYVEKETVKALEDFSENDLKIEHLNDACKRKSWYVMEEFGKRNWL